MGVSIREWGGHQEADPGSFTGKLTVLRVCRPDNDVGGLPRFAVESESQPIANRVFFYIRAADRQDAFRIVHKGYPHANILGFSRRRARGG